MIDNAIRLEEEMENARGERDKEDLDDIPGIEEQ